jgi:hypothetical protein
MITYYQKLIPGTCDEPLTTRQMKRNTFFFFCKSDLLPKFESLKCNSFGFIQNIKLLQLHIHEQYFILSWIYHKVCHNEWYKKA